MIKKSTIHFTAILSVVFLLLINNIVFSQKPSPGPKPLNDETNKQSMLGYEKYFEENKEQHLKEFIDLVSIPSISSMPSHKADVKKAAEWIVNKLKSIGITTAMEIPTGGNPIVFGSWDKAPGKPTV
ncbi:MAG: hypothetical protein WCP74_13375, partial [Sphingobacteriia bacterium]